MGRKAQRNSSRSIVKIEHTSVYAPVRFEATRPFALRLGRFIATRFTPDDAARVKFLNDELAPTLLREIEALGHQDGPGPWQAETSNLQTFAAFCHANRIVFDLHSTLSNALLNTDIAEIPCIAFSMPYESVYVHFGSGSGLEDQGKEIEGAFITLYSFQSMRRLLVDLVPRDTFTFREFWIMRMGEQLISVNIQLSDHMTMIEALHNSIAGTIKQNQEIMAAAEKAEHEIFETHGEIVKVPWRGERLAEYQPLLERALMLVVNAMFYLAAVPEDSCEDWEADTPSTLRELIDSPKLGAKRTGEATAETRGYIKVNYVGRKFALSQASASIDDQANGMKLSPHMRRGHFRHQRHGIGNLQIKLIFIAPVVVNAELGDLPGRIYDVD